MNRLEFAHPTVYSMVAALTPDAQVHLLLGVIGEIEREGSVVGVDWDLLRRTVRAGGAGGVGTSLATLAEKADDVAFDYSDADDARYDAAFATARSLSALAYACSPVTRESCSDALYELIGIDGDDRRARQVLALVRK